MANDIYNENDSATLLGILFNDPSLFENEKYPLTKYDFAPLLFHKIIYVCGYNLINHGAKEIDAMMVEEYLTKYPTFKTVYMENNGAEFINTIKGISDNKIDNIEYYWKSIRKHSILRKYKDIGFDISEVWDFDKSIENNEKELDNWELIDIFNIFEKKQSDIKKQYIGNTVKEEYIAGTDFDETKERFKEEPLMGNSFQSEYINGIFRGMFGFILRVAKSGGGKTALSVGDICKVTCKEYYSPKDGKFITNKSRAGASLFINTEMELREQLDPMFISWISNVDRSHIIDGKYEEDEEERVDYASKILKESELYVVDDPEFTTKSLTQTIENYCRDYNIKTVCFDYCQNNGFVAKEISSETKVPQREDMVLLALTDRLKQVQRKCKISLISSVQTNGLEDSMEYPTEAVMAGGKSQVRKTDGTMCMLPPTKKELEQTSMLLQKRGFTTDLNYINNVVHIIKGRGSRYPKNIKVFQHMDLGTLRTIDLYCTDKFNRPINVDKLIIENKE